MMWRHPQEQADPHAAHWCGRTAVRRESRDGEVVVGRFNVDLAGTGGWHVGEQADRRMRQAARARGIAVTSRARKVTVEDFERFDHVFAMDAENLRTLHALAPPLQHHKLRLFRDLDPDAPGEDVPDPYGGGPDDFDEVLDIVTRTGRALLEELTARHDA